MKRKNILIFSLATLVVTANVAPAQDAQPQHTPVKVIRDGKTATVVADKDAPYDEIRKALEEARSAGAEAVKMLTQVSGPDGKNFSTRLQSIIRRANPPSRILVIPKDDDGARNIAEVEEDLKVMAHILDKAVSGDGDKSARAMGIVVTPRPPGSASGPQNLFIEGYGALFFLNVNYPLVPPPATDTKPATKDQTSSEWEEAKREISQPPQRYGSSGFEGGADVGPFAPGGRIAEYHAEKVEDLKKDLTEALKNAAYIRRLKSDEIVTVVITAPGTPAAPETKPQPSTGDSGSDVNKAWEDNYRAAMDAFENAYGNPPSGPSTKLIVRVRKADAEAFQKGDLSLDEFRKKVTEFLY